MTPADGADITRLLNRAALGDAEAEEKAWSAVYDEVRHIAKRELARRGGGTLSTTGLIHEVYVKLNAPSLVSVENRRHFFGLACRAMRQVLVDRARHRKAEKRGGGLAPLTLEPDAAVSSERDARLLDLDDALTELGRINPRLVRVVECRFFGGLTFEETAEALGISHRTAEREWARARTHLYRLLQPEA